MSQYLSKHVIQGVEKYEIVWFMFLCIEFTFFLHFIDFVKEMWEKNLLSQNQIILNINIVILSYRIKIL